MEEGETEAHVVIPARNCEWDTRRYFAQGDESVFRNISARRKRCQLGRGLNMLVKYFISTKGASRDI